MYVCVCNAVTERQIVKAVEAGCQTMKDLRDELGVGACCGRCAGCARSVLRQTVKAGNEPIFPVGALALTGT